MITLNGKQFARNDSEFTDSLFTSGGTCAGYYKPNKRSISLLDMQKNKVGVITNRGVLACATKRDNGYWYSYGDIDLIGRYESYMQQVDESLAALEAANIKRIL